MKKDKESQLNFFSEFTEFSISSTDSSSISKWINSSIIREGKIPSKINIILSNDDYLHKINVKYLNHNTLTDVITFDYVDGDIISGDIFISIERVRENADKNKETFKNELYRVIIHGILHLLGYNDKTNEEKESIRAKEDFYLALLTQ